MRKTAGALLALLAVAALAVGVRWQATRYARSDPLARPIPRSTTLFVLRLPSGPLSAVIASGGEAMGSAIVVPSSAIVTVPGQGESSVADAISLPGPPATAAVSNLLATWIDHYAITDGLRLASRIDRKGGLSLFGERVSGRGVLSALAGTGRIATWREVVRALLWSPDPWRASDFSDTDDGPLVARLLHEAGHVPVTPLPTGRVPGGALEIDDVKAGPMLRAFGRTVTRPVPVVVLNGSGLPDVGRAAAERLIPAGFRIVSSDNAARLDHEETLVVANGPDVQVLAARAQRALGVGRVSVSAVPLGLASVTIVLGKDFRPE